MSGVVVILEASACTCSSSFNSCSNARLPRDGCHNGVHSVHIPSLFHAPLPVVKYVPLLCLVMIEGVIVDQDLPIFCDIFQ